MLSFHQRKSTSRKGAAGQQRAPALQCWRPSNPCSSPRSCKGHYKSVFSSSGRGQPRQAFHAKCFCSYRKNPNQTGIQQFSACKGQTPALAVLTNLPSPSTWSPQQCLPPGSTPTFWGNQSRERHKTGGGASAACCWDKHHPNPILHE